NNGAFEISSVARHRVILKIFCKLYVGKILLNGQTPATPIPKVLEILELSLNLMTDRLSGL
ncbi:MAG: hypothetical protein M3P47_06005, partial [Pseudomonadota bacterium]|nr:hypothetical protein [Pseudomonadota bacterium]